MPEHSTIQSADCHEPKAITTSTTADTGKVITPSGTTSGTSELRKVKALELDSTGGSEGQVLEIVSGTPAWVTPGAEIYGGLKTTDGAIDIATVGVTAKKLLAFLTAMPSNGVTASTTTDDILIITAGDYMIDFGITFGTSAAGDAGLYTFHVRVNNTEVGLAVGRQMSGSSDTGAISLVGLLTLATDDVISVYIESDDGGDSDDIDILHTQFFAELLKAS